MQPFGDLGVNLITFEETLTLRAREQVINRDGFAEPVLGDAATFKGVIAPGYDLDPRFGGIRLQGDSILYVRLTQSEGFEIALDDIVVDSSGQEWKVLAVYDYSNHGRVKMYDVKKVEPKC